MNLQTSIKTCFQKKFTIKGRASRSEFWWFFLFIFIVTLLLRFFGDYQFFRYNPYLFELKPFSTLWSLITFPALICVYIRRLHDINKTGWSLLLYFISIIVSIMVSFIITIVFEQFSDIIISIASLVIVFGAYIVFIVFYCKKGTAGDNRFGADPLAE